MRIVNRRKGFAYQVDCRRKGWTGPAQPEFLTKKEALDKAREVAALVDDKGVEGAGSYTNLLENGELAEFAKQLQPFGKTIAVRSPITWRCYGPNNPLRHHHWSPRHSNDGSPTKRLEPMASCAHAVWGRYDTGLNDWQRFTQPNDSNTSATNSSDRPKTTCKPPRANQPALICGSTLWVTSVSSSTGAFNKDSPTSTPQFASR